MISIVQYQKIGGLMRKFILDTDWWTDCDDAVAVRLLCNAHVSGEVELLGININACMPYSIPSLDVFYPGLRCGSSAFC